MQTSSRFVLLFSTVLALAGCDAPASTGDVDGGDTDGGGIVVGGDDDGGGGGAFDLGPRGMPSIPQGHPRIYLNAANRARLAARLTSGEEAATRFRAIVDAAVGGADIYDYHAWFSALVGQLTGDARSARRSCATS